MPIYIYLTQIYSNVYKIYKILKSPMDEQYTR